MKPIFLAVAAAFVVGASGPGGPARAQAPASSPPATPSCRQAPDELCDTGRTFKFDEVGDRLGDREWAWWIDGDDVVQVQRAPSAPILCCFGAPFRLHPVTGAPNVWAIAVKAPRLDEAVLTVPTPAGRKRVWRGGKAPPAAPTAAPPADWLSSVDIPSRTIGKPTRLYIYSPPHEAGTMPVLYVADGEAVDQLAGIVHGLAVAGRGPEVMLIGLVPDGREMKVLDDKGLMVPAPPEQRKRASDLRTQDYLLGYPGGEKHFAELETVLISEVLPYAESRLGAATTPALRGVLGWSEAGCWAFDMAARNSALFGTAIALSCGGGKPIDSLRNATVRQLFAGAGLYEPAALRATRQGADALAPNAARLQMQVRVGGRDEAVWMDQVAQAIPWAFGAEALAGAKDAVKPAT